MPTSVRNFTKTINVICRNGSKTLLTILYYDLVEKTLSAFRIYRYNNATTYSYDAFLHAMFLVIAIIQSSTNSFLLKYLAVLRILSEYNILRNENVMRSNYTLSTSYESYYIYIYVSLLAAFVVRVCPYTTYIILLWFMVYE